MKHKAECECHCGFVARQPITHREAVIAARLKVKLNTQLGRETPDWIIELAKEEKDND